MAADVRVYQMHGQRTPDAASPHNFFRMTGSGFCTPAGGCCQAGGAPLDRQRSSGYDDHRLQIQVKEFGGERRWRKQAGLPDQRRS
jgi:hypothetical protein